jgi:hypothetical protein
MLSVGDVEGGHFTLEKEDALLADMVKVLR